MMDAAKSAFKNDLMILLASTRVIFFLSKRRSRIKFAPEEMVFARAMPPCFSGCIRE